MKKVIDIEDRIPSMREQRRKRSNRKFVLIIAAFFIALLVILYFQSSLSRIKAVDIIGAYIHDENVYFEESNLQVGNNIWGFSKNDVEEKLLKLHGVKEVSVARKWLREVEIVIQEWKPVAYLETEEDFQLLLENGMIFNKNEKTIEKDLPILNDFETTNLQKDIALQLLEIESNLNQLISEIIYTGTEEDPETITLFMNDGYEIRALIPSLAEKMMYYSDIVAQLNGEEKGVIDMEVGTFFTPFSKYYGVETPVEEDDVDE